MNTSRYCKNSLAYVWIFIIGISCSTKQKSNEFSNPAIVLDSNSSILYDTMDSVSSRHINEIIDYGSLGLEPIERNAINENCIEQTNAGLMILNDKKITNIILDKTERAYVSQNQKYYVRQKISLLNSNSGISDKVYEFDLYNIENKSIAKTKIKSLGSDEAEDKIIPLNDGSGFLQMAFRLGTSFSYKIYKLNKENRFSESLKLKDDQAFGSIVSMSSDSKYLFSIYSKESKVADSTNSLTIEKWNVDGKLEWRKVLQNMRISQGIYQSDNGRYMGFGYAASLKNYSNAFCILNWKGEIIFNRKLDSIAYDGCLFIQTKEKDYALIQGRNSIHQVDLNSMIVNRSILMNDQMKEIIMTSWINDNIVSIYSNVKYENSKKNYLNSQLCLIDNLSTEKCFKIDMVGKPELFKNDTNYYLKFESNTSDFKYYKIKTPLYEKDY